MAAFNDRLVALEGIPTLQGQLRDVRQVMKAAKGERLEKAKAIEKEVLGLIEARKIELLEIGAAGQALLNKDIATVLPLDDARLLDEAKPVMKDGQITFDAEKVNKRQDAMVKAVLDNGNFGLIVLGASHNLTENVRRQSKSCEYIRVWVREWQGAGWPI